MKILITPKIIEALEYAAIAHTGQKRVVTGAPYISHPFGVSLILANAGYGEDVVVAGVLHDVIEDTEEVESTIAYKFGTNVSEMVHGASEDKTIKVRAERKLNHLEKLRNSSLEVLAIIAADMLHNRYCAMLELKGGRTREQVANDTTTSEYIREGFEKMGVIQERLHNEIVIELEKVMEEIKILFAQ